MNGEEKQRWRRALRERYNLSDGRCNECGKTLQLNGGYLNKAIGHHVIPRHFRYHETENCRVRCYFCEVLAHALFPENDGNIHQADRVSFVWFRQAVEMRFWLECWRYLNSDPPDNSAHKKMGSVRKKTSRFKKKKRGHIQDLRLTRRYVFS